MNVAPYLIPEAPPAELLAELDEAARRLDELSARALELTLDMNEQTRSLELTVAEDGRVRSLTPTQLFDLLDPA
ncbi:MAG TPA: hypothetical protein VM184_10080 [Gaiellaceae bacterium]|nr:hypothetical protein [Gaiellaceae bacterium]